VPLVDGLALSRAPRAAAFKQSGGAAKREFDGRGTAQAGAPPHPALARLSDGDGDAFNCRG
jgi:hypothetical protein